ncbi:hypothetical protein [Piscirickettsia litoralis]|uniref:FYVE-type domain-containing protein n=1 Tax=Piscirickettsia litoralis TaxID=1891921 RepID=A0ABX3A5N9_9GAMM|nr:hypothetical protein [Piscirickettsia litoralis]ODN43959.1 hypothetical protein BGC07_15045 [Piscirickettsia litoralis]
MGMLFPSVTSLAVSGAKSGAESLAQKVMLQKLSEVVNGKDESGQINEDLALANHCWKQLPQKVSRTGIRSKRVYWMKWYPKIRSVGEKEKLLMILACYEAANVSPSCEQFRINTDAAYKAFPILGPKKLVMDPSLTRKNLRGVLKRKPILSYSNIGVSTAFAPVALDLLNVLNEWSNKLNGNSKLNYEEHYKDRLWLVGETYEFIDQLSYMNIDYYTLDLLASRVYLWWMLTSVKAKTNAEKPQEYEILGHDGINEMYKELFKRGYQHLERLLVEFCTRALVCKLDEAVNLFEASILSAEQFLTSRDILAHSSQKQEIYEGKKLAYEYVNPEIDAVDDEALDLRNERLVTESKRLIKVQLGQANNYISLCSTVFGISGALKVNSTKIKASDAQRYLKCVQKVAEDHDVKESIVNLLKVECESQGFGQSIFKSSDSFRKTFMGHMSKHPNLYDDLASLILKQMVLFSMNNIMIFYRDYIQEFGDSRIGEIGSNCSALLNDIHNISGDAYRLMINISESYKSKLTNSAKEERYGDFRSEIYGLGLHMRDLTTAFNSRAQEVQMQLKLYKDGIKMSAIRGYYYSSAKQSKKNFLSILGIFDEQDRFDDALITLSVSTKQLEGNEGGDSPSTSSTNNQLKKFVEGQGENLRASLRNYYKTVSENLYESLRNIFENASLVSSATGDVGQQNPLLRKIGGLKLEGVKLKGYDDELGVVGQQLDEEQFNIKLADEVYQKISAANFYEGIYQQNREGKFRNIKIDYHQKKRECRRKDCKNWSMSETKLHSCRVCFQGKFCNSHITRDSDTMHNEYVCNTCREDIGNQKYEKINAKRELRGFDKVKMYDVQDV